MKWLVGKREMAVGRERSNIAKGTASYIDLPLLYNKESSKKAFVNQNRCSGYPCTTSTDCKTEGELTVQMEGKRSKRSSSHSHQPTGVKEKPCFARYPLA